MSKEYLTTTETADALGLSVQTLYQWKSYGGGPYGISPRKLKNGELLWPKKEVYRVAKARENG